MKKAVALIYEKKTDSAPKIVAKARGSDAEWMEVLALEAQILTEKNPFLADALEALPLLSEVPEELYQLISQIYAQLMKLNQEFGSSGEE